MTICRGESEFQLGDHGQYVRSFLPCMRLLTSLAGEISSIQASTAEAYLTMVNIDITMFNVRGEIGSDNSWISDASPDSRGRPRHFLSCRLLEGKKVEQRCRPRRLERLGWVISEAWRRVGVFSMRKLAATRRRENLVSTTDIKKSRGVRMRIHKDASMRIVSTLEGIAAGGEADQSRPTSWGYDLGYTRGLQHQPWGADFS